MISIRALAVSGVLAVVPVSLHLAVRAADAVDRAATSKLAEVRETALSAAATYLGYEPRREPEEELGPRVLCTMEAVKRGINPAVVCSLLHVESGADQFAVSSKGALGYMQVMPSNIPLLKECGVKSKGDLFDAQKNICSGVLLFDRFLRQHEDDPVTALQAYNGGSGCVGRCSESINHAKKVLKRTVRDVN